MSDTKIEKKKLTVYISPETFKKMKFLAIDMDTTLSNIVDTALKEFIERESSN